MRPLRGGHHGEEPECRPLHRPVPIRSDGPALRPAAVVGKPEGASRRAAAVEDAPARARRPSVGSEPARGAAPARAVSERGLPRPKLALTRRVDRPRDPAPSRLGYRLRRAWMRAWVRRAATRGLPALVLALALAAWLGDGEEVERLRERWEELRAQIEARPEFAVTEARIEGAGPQLEPLLRAALPALPSSSLRLDLEAVRAAMAELPPVEHVEVQVMPRGVLSVRVEERRPALLWRGPDGLTALDVQGRALRRMPSRSGRSDLPLIAGEGAERAVPEALALHAVAGPLGPKLRGLVRVGDRRWDAVLDGGLRVMLPEEGAGAALERAAALEAAQDLTGRDLTHLDLRDPDRTVLRLEPRSMAEMAARLADERAGPPATGSDAGGPDRAPPGGVGAAPPPTGLAPQTLQSETPDR